MSILGVTIDGEADVAYATLSTRPVARTVELDCGLIVDLAADGTLVGIEVLGYSKPFEAVRAHSPGEATLIAMKHARRLNPSAAVLAKIEEIEDETRESMCTCGSFDGGHPGDCPAVASRPA